MRDRLPLLIGLSFLSLAVFFGAFRSVAAKLG
jgi:hypothetical protein